jgi:hypothetical protein
MRIALKRLPSGAIPPGAPPALPLPTPTLASNPAPISGEAPTKPTADPLSALLGTIFK